MSDNNERINPDFYYEVGENMYLSKEKHINTVERVEAVLNVLRNSVMESAEETEDEIHVPKESLEKVFDTIEAMCSFGSHLATLSEEEAELLGVLCRDFFKATIANKDKNDYEISSFTLEHLTALNYNAITLWLLMCGAIGFDLKEILVEEDSDEIPMEEFIIDIYQTKDHL